MLAAVLMSTLILVPAAVVLVLGILGHLAVYQENPVIDLVEEYRKKYSSTNEN